MEQRLATQLKDLILKKIVGMWWEAWLCPVTTLGVVKCKVSVVKFASINNSKSLNFEALCFSHELLPLSCTVLSVAQACVSLICSSSTIFLILKNSKTIKFCLLPFIS